MSDTAASTDPIFYAVTEATWPAHRQLTCGPITLREGRGGGSRVSAATLDQPTATATELATAEAAMVQMGQDRLFMIRDGQDALDAQLAERGYVVKDPVQIWDCPVALLCDLDIPPVTAFAIEEPLAIQREIWAQGGIGPERLAVMERVTGPKITLLGRWDDSPAGTGFVAIHAGVAMVHALEILPHQRRRGMGAWLMRRAALWAQEQGADRLAVLCTKANPGANGLYASLGMTPAGGYHYRYNPDGV
ncbi:GNAT family N-acetyltransferase [Phaeobacter sp.]|uniref:GNAT family N-acetyltransferase n=1 Tax=Phaeobacter sp. TaxID=1902409 RepID=UPI0025F73B98|nr:GNAT family N-acetyltransferase [Phaeobacter sp.]